MKHPLLESFNMSSLTDSGRTLWRFPCWCLFCCSAVMTLPSTHYQYKLEAQFNLWTTHLKNKLISIGFIYKYLIYNFFFLYYDTASCKLLFYINYFCDSDILNIIKIIILFMFSLQNFILQTRLDHSCYKMCQPTEGTPILWQFGNVYERLSEDLYLMSWQDYEGK